MWDKIKDFLVGSAGKLITDVGDVVDRFVTTGPEKAEMKRLMTELVHKQEMELQRFTLEAEGEFNRRVESLEGTATDLKQAGWLGRIVLFFRGLQRPLWGYGVMFMDFMVFSGKWIIEDDQLKSAFWIINFLVLGFLFGERAVKNVGPLVQGMFKK